MNRVGDVHNVLGLLGEVESEVAAYASRVLRTQTLISGHLIKSL